MQKKIIALAIAAALAAPVAMAQVVVYGSIDAGLRKQTNDAAATGTTTATQFGQYSPTRWGIRSTEDLGDGMKANVVVEGSLTSPVAPLTATNGIFNRQMTVGVETSAYKFDMGWQNTVSFKTIGTYDPMNFRMLEITGMNAAGGITKAMAVRSGGMQVSSKFGDVTVTAGYDSNNAQPAAQATTGTGRVVAATYASGAINAGAAYSAQESGTTGNFANAATHVTAGAGYNFGDGKVSVGYAKKATGAAVNEATVTDMWLGASYNMSPKIGVTAAYYSTATNTGVVDAANATRNVMVVAGTYALSKRTQLYAAIDRTASDTGLNVTTEPGNSKTVMSGTSLGITTTF